MYKNYTYGDLVLGDHPEISIIIPTHNHAHFLPECLASVKAQTYKNYEVIVINNGSTDNTEQVVSDLAWDRLQYHYQDDTGSVAGPRNTGIKLANGEYVAFLDSDDVWYEKKLEKVMEVLENDPQIDICSHDLFFVRPGRKKITIKTGPLRDNMFENLLIRNRLLGSATVVKKNVMVEIGGFDGCSDFIHAEDYETWLRIAYLSKKFHFINEVLGEYRAHSSNLSLDFERVLLNEKNVIRKHLKNFNSTIPFYSYFLYNHRLSGIYFNMGVQYCFRKKYTKGLFNFARSFMMSPFSLSNNISAFLKLIK